jgi:capsular polysaccharide biosynthesis protein
MISKDRLKEILEDPSFKQVIDDIIKGHVEVIINSSDNDEFTREKAYTRIRVTKELVDHIQSIIDSTKIEDAKWTL